MRILEQSDKKVHWFILMILAIATLLLIGFQLTNGVVADPSINGDGPGDIPQTLPWIHAGDTDQKLQGSSSYTYTVYLPLVTNSSSAYEPSVLLVAFDTGTNSDFVNMLATTYNAFVLDRLPNTDIYRWQFPPGTDILSMQQVVSNDPAVHYAEPDYQIKLLDTFPNDPRHGDQWALTRVWAYQAWDVTRGSSSVVIAIVDTGVDLGHPDLTSKLTSTDTWYDFGNGDSDPRDTYGHGTHCAGIAAAASNNATGVAGLSWHARIMPVKVFPDNSGSTTSYSVARGILHAANKGADIISLSLGSSSPSEVIREAINYAHNNSIIVVAAAGNSSSSSKNYPAAFDHVISVASTASNDRKSYFSNYGTWVDVSAPGSYILSTMPTYHVVLNDYGYSMSYDELSGTSMATPYVAGLASLVVTNHPGWSPEQVETHILDTADNIDGANPGYAGLLGSGRINAYSAVQGGGTPPPTPTPTPIPTPPPSSESMVAFVSDRDGDFEIYTMDVDGTGVTQLTHNQAKDEGPSWSPDGSRIVFHSERDGHSQIYVMDADGSNETRLLASAAWDGWVYWSPDGTKVAFSRWADHDGTGDYRTEAYVMNANGTNVKRLTYSSALGSGAGAWPSGWSPDSSQILFYWYRGGYNQLWIMNSDGSSQRKLTTDTHWNAIPTMSPDGTRIAFASYRDGNYEIYVMNSDGTNPTRLTYVSEEDWRPTWSQDGSKILFESKRDGRTQVYWMNPDGSQQTRLTSNTAYDGQAVWRPSGH
jgi:thermitase